MTPKKFSTEVKKRARELRAQGWKLKDIAAELGASKKNISDWTCRRMPKPATETQSQDEAAVRARWRKEMPGLRARFRAEIAEIMAGPA